MTTAWGITDGSTGMVNQVKAMAMALGVPIELKKVVIRTPYVWLPNPFHAMFLKPFIFPGMIEGSVSDHLKAPWPELIISCGRRGAIAAMGLRHYIAKQKKRFPTRFIHIQDPHVNSHNFDVVVAMEHDRITGDNVIKTRFSLHSITPDALALAAEKFRPKFAAYPEPYIAVLLGGATHRYKFTSFAMLDVIKSLQTLADQTKGSLLITPSRRTGEANIAQLRQTFADYPRVCVYDGEGENPYMGMLALAERIVVTNDSVNMMTEAQATGKPFYILPLHGHKNTKAADFAQRLLFECIARPLEEPRGSWTYPVNNEMGHIAEQIRRMLLEPL